MSRERRIRLVTLLSMVLVVAGVGLMWLATSVHADAESRLRSELARALSRAYELDLMLRVDPGPLWPDGADNARDAVLGKLDQARADAEDDERKALTSVRACVVDRACEGGLNAAVLRVKAGYARPLSNAQRGLDTATVRANRLFAGGGISVIVAAVLLIFFVGQARSVGVAEHARAGDSGEGDSDQALDTERARSGATASDVRSRAKGGSTKGLEKAYRDRLEQLYQARKLVRDHERFAAYGEIAAGLSHGLKTPLAAMRAAAQVAQAKIGDHPAADNLDDIIDQIDGLVAQIMRFLATMGSGAPTLERVPPADIVSDLNDYYVGNPGAPGVRWETQVADPICDIMGEPQLLQMALRNLIDNAYSVAPEGTVVTLDARLCDAPARAGLEEVEPSIELRDLRWVELTVVDAGSGVPREIRDREQAVSTRPGGSGLGLAIARRIAARHGGRLELEPNQDTGTRARLVLPPADALPSAPERPEEVHDA